MNRIIIAPIVEGHGEVAAVPIVLRRIWTEMLGGDYAEVLRPFRDKRDRLAENKNAILHKAIQFAFSRLSEFASGFTASLILVLLDADDDKPCILGPDVLELAEQGDSRPDISCVIANVEFETWFVAAAASLEKYLRLPPAAQLPTDPERDRLGKGWIEQHFAGVKYSETVDQPRLAASMDLGLCRKNSPSFDKLCRELDSRLRIENRQS